MALTCVSCKLLFSVPQLHQEHYKTDWHRYNLKRRLAEYPPVTKEEYEKRAAAFKDEGIKIPQESMLCSTCNKHFRSKNAWANHMKSNKHLETEAKASKRPAKVIKKISEKPQTIAEAVAAEKSKASAEGDDEEMDEEEDEDGWESCSDSENDEEEGKMKRIVVDTDDCLFCGHHSESSVENVSHMTTDHSFFIPDVEYLENLDGLIATLAAKIQLGHCCLWCNKHFKSAGSVRKHMSDKGHTKMLYEGESVLEYADFYNYSPMEGEEAPDVSAIDAMLFDADYELVLPSGSTVGHRSLAMYYKQNLKLASDTQQKVKKVLSYYKSLGYTGVSGPAAVVRARDIAYMQKIKKRRDLKMGIKTNKFQPHFRPQVMF